jgi:hypothetical protein
MDDRDITIENDSQISEPELAERAIGHEESRGDFAVDHAWFGVKRSH